ncbi:uncharacterized protein KIAA2012 homolog isoform X2 [Sarcophilus harrisii]|uniref:uncharacterized protein KIAA2012 homolog isoform X2 n=1 Tax=Sarcophilus harrisii TaxID=9305 RepID=UPI001301C014|nr:uncharacterized protein KIAA2012 homolog isoform X2 [Sarcophilus harrisii]
MFPLSLLSRGNGQVVQNKQKRLEVYLEPEDYLNWTPQEKSLISWSQDGAQIKRVSLPKTYSTRKGALILYSEDFAEPSWKQEEKKKGPRPYRHQKKRSGFALHTLKDLTAAILAYGSDGKDQKDQGWQPYLHFLSKSHSQTEQQIRPGYSAKRYFLSLFKNWTPGTLYKLQCSDGSDLDSEESGNSDVEKEDSRVEKHWEEKVPLPPLRQKPPGRATQPNDEALMEDTWMEEQQGTQALKTNQKQHGKSHSPLGTDSVFDDTETSQVLSGRSHSTFYGGNFPDRKTYLSGNVKTSKSRHQMFLEPPSEKCFLPPVQSTVNSEPSTPKKVKKKKMSKSLKLPSITEELPRTQDPLKNSFNDYSIPEELLILPVEVHLCAEHQLKEREKGQKEESWNTECSPEADAEGRSFPRQSLKQACYSQQPGTVQLPRDAGTDFSHPHGITQEIRNIGTKSSKIQQKTSGSRSPKDLMDDDSDLLEDFTGSSQDPALGNILMGPAEDIVCQPFLGSGQSMDLPLQLDFASGEAHQSGDSNTYLGEECSSDQQVRKGNIDSEASLHANIYENISLTPEPAEKEIKKGQEYQRRQSRTIIENQQQDLGNRGSGLKVGIQAEKSSSDSHVFPESSGPGPTQDIYAPLHLELPVQSFSDIETEKPKPQGDGSPRKEVEKQRDRTSGSLGTSVLKHNLTSTAETIKELPLGNGPVPPKTVRKKKQSLSRSRKGKDVPPKLGKLAAENIHSEKQLPEKTKRKKKNEVNKPKASLNVGKGEKPQNKTEIVGGKPKKQKTEKKTSKKKISRAKRKETVQKDTLPTIESETNYPSSPEDVSDEECSFSSYNSQDFILPPKFQTPESQVSRDKRLSPVQTVIVKENVDSEEDKSADTSKALPVNQQQEKVPRERILSEKAEMRLREVERKRQQKEEKKRQLQEEQQRLEKIKEELEQEQARKAEEKRLQKEKLEEEKRQQEEEERKRLQQERAAEARAKQQQEEFRRKLQEMQRKKQEEEARRAEAEKQRQKELERQLEEEHQRLIKIANEEQLEYQRRRKEEEEKARCNAETKKRREEEEARLAMEEVKKKAKQLEREKLTLEAHQLFKRQLLREANELKHVQSISRPWVYSYFQLLQKPSSEVVTKEK